jgi:hypothetical protein
MLLRIACTRCRLASLWTDEPRCFLATVCRAPRHCEATLHDERFGATPGSEACDARSSPATVVRAPPD